MTVLYLTAICAFAVIGLALVGRFVTKERDRDLPYQTEKDER